MNTCTNPADELTSQADPSVQTFKINIYWVCSSIEEPQLAPYTYAVAIHPRCQVTTRGWCLFMVLPSRNSLPVLQYNRVASTSPLWPIVSIFGQLLQLH